MATTFTIPLTTLTVGVHTFGPLLVDSALSKITVSIDRTVAGGLDSLTSASVLAGTADYSLDGGTTYQNSGTFTTPGGPVFNKDGTQLHGSTVIIVPIPGVGQSGRLVRSKLTVQGSSPIVVAGSITAS